MVDSNSPRYAFLNTDTGQLGGPFDLAGFVTLVKSDPANLELFELTPLSDTKIDAIRGTTKDIDSAASDAAQEGA